MTAKPQTEPTQLLAIRDYVLRQRRDCETAIAEDAASAKYQKNRGSKRERQITYTKGSSTAYEDVLRQINAQLGVLKP